MIPDLLGATIPVFLIMATGFVMQWRGWIEPNLDVHLMRLGLNLLLPCFIMANVIGSEALDDFSDVILAVLLGYVLVVLSIGISYLTAPLFGLKPGHGMRTFALSTAIQNYGFVAIPVLVALFGRGPLGVLFLHGMGVELALWTVGVTVLQGASGARWGAVINGPFIAVLASLILHYLQGDQWIPGPLLKAIDMLGATAVPLALFSIGIAIAFQMQSEKTRIHWPTVTGACCLRLLVLPVLFLVAIRFLPMGLELRQVLLVQAVMPAAIIPIVLAKIYGGHPSTAIQVVLATTVGSFITMPIVLTLGRRWLGI